MHSIRLVLRIIQKDIHLIEKALKGKFIIQEFGLMTEKIEEIYKECVNITDGKVK